MKKLTGHLEEKNGKWYAAVNHYTTDGKRKVKWYSLDLESRKGSKTEANHRLRALLEKLNRRCARSVPKPSAEGYTALQADDHQVRRIGGNVWNI